eukprot:scaffold2687_cov305-Pinguiococcus_pyrenoidosus.AAC.5
MVAQRSYCLKLDRCPPGPLHLGGPVFEGFIGPGENVEILTRIPGPLLVTRAFYSSLIRPRRCVQIFRKVRSAVLEQIRRLVGFRARVTVRAR